MDLSGLAALSSAVYPGYVQGQKAELALQEQREKQAAFIRQRQAEAILGRDLAALPSASPPPPQLPPQGPGQASVPRQPVENRAMPAPGAASPLQPNPAAAPFAAPASGSAPAPGMMTVEQLAQGIVRSNPQIDWSRPESQQLLVTAVERKQALLAPQERAKLEQMKYEREQTRLDMQERKGDLDRQERIRHDQVMERLGFQRDASANARADKTLAAREKAMDDGELSDEDAKLLAENTLTTGKMPAMGYGPAGQRNRKKVLEQLRKLGPDGADLARSQADFAGTTAGLRTLHQQNARIETAMNEVKRFGPMVRDLSAKIDRTKYPTLNSMILAAKKGTGDPDVVRFVDALNGLKTAYAQALSRGGQVTEGNRKRADEVIEKAFSAGQIDAAVDQIAQEIQLAQEAAKESIADLTNRVGRRGETAASADPSAAASAGDIPDAARAQLKEGVVTTFGNGQRWTLKGGKPEQVK